MTLFAVTEALAPAADTPAVHAWPNLFQTVVLIALGLLILRDGFFARLAGGWPERLVRVLVWTLAALAVAFPLLVQSVADRLGIGRGADVLLYLSVLGFVWVSFALYANQLRLQRQLTAVVRQMAIRDAVQGQPKAE